MGILIEVDILPRNGDSIAPLNGIAFNGEPQGSVFVTTKRNRLQLAVKL